MKKIILFVLQIAILYSAFYGMNPIHSSPDSISIDLKNTYKNGNHISEKDTKQIMKIMRNVSKAVIDKNPDNIIRYISKEKGAYLDLKGLWEYEDLVKEFKEENSYLEIYFFNHEKLEKQKKSNEVLTVRELLQKSDGIEIDLFFESNTSCEGKIKFKKNRKLEREMNNPYFLKVKGKWYLYRLF